MQYLRFFSLGILAAVFFFLGLTWALLPSGYEVVATGLIHAPKRTVYEQMANLRNWENWVYSGEGDLGVTFHYAGAEEGQGAISEWDSEQGKGRLEVVGATPYEKVDIKGLLQDGTFENHITIELSEENGYTSVRWTESGDFGWNPLVRLAVSLMDYEQKLTTNYQAAFDRLNLFFDNQ